MTLSMFGKSRFAAFCGFWAFSAVLAFFAGNGAVFAQTYSPDNWYAQNAASQRADTGTRVADVISPGRPAAPRETAASAPAARPTEANNIYSVTQAGYQTPANPAGANVGHATLATHHEPPRTPAPTRETASPAAANQPGEIVPKINIPTSSDGLIAFQEILTTPTGKVQQLTIIDPKQRSICVYHVDMNTGQIELRSARDIQWDLQMNYLNSKKPLPHEVRGILQGAKN